MSSMAAAVGESRRRRLTARQADTVDRLADAAVDEMKAMGYEGLTVRNVARRAGVAPATAYTYFASKDHLVSEVFWRRLHDAPVSRVDRRRTAASRVATALADVTALLRHEPELATAATAAMLGADPDVKHLRDRIGAEIRGRVEVALGADGDRRVLRALDFAVAGALLQAGMGHLSYDELPARLADVAALLLDGHP